MKKVGSLHFHDPAVECFASPEDAVAHLMMQNYPQFFSREELEAAGVLPDPSREIEDNQDPYTMRFYG